MPGCWPVGLGSERRAVRASLSGREPATGIVLGRGVTLLPWAHGVGVHADAPAHSFPTNADARGEAVRTMPRTLACYPPDRMTAGGSRAVTKYITSAAWRLRCRPHCRCVVHGGKHSPPSSARGGRDEHAPCLSPPPPPPRTVEQPQACSISRSFMAAPLHNKHSCTGAWSGRQALCTRVPEVENKRRAPTLSRCPPRTEEQPQACSIILIFMFMAAPLQT